MIVVAGGTGTLGAGLVPLLADLGVAVRVLTRDPARAQHLAGPGIEVVCGDVRDPASIAGLLRGAETVISAVHGFAGPGHVSPATVDRAGNAHLIEAATRAGAAFVLVSVVCAAPDHPIGLFRAKYAAEQALRASGTPWTIVRATAFMETWGKIMGQALQASGKLLVLGRGDNPINFVSATDVAALVGLAATGNRLHGQLLELGGPANLSFNQVADILRAITGVGAAVRHIPRPVLRAMAVITAGLNPAFARQTRAAVVMDTIDMTFDPAPTRNAFPDLPITDMPTALKELLA
ncbi:MAG: SDR family oxidoreductase [Streptosporangiaceae bacterium]